MSTPPREGQRPKVRITDLAERVRQGQPIVMVTAYDFPTAEIVDEAGVDLVLVGDSAANVVLGYPSTVPVTVEELLVLVKAVRRGLHAPLLVGDLPFGSYEVSDEQAVATAVRFVKEGGADAVKLERGGTSVARAAAIVAAGIPVMGHVGLTPQTATSLGGFRAQGRRAAGAADITRHSLALQHAGCFSIVLEAVPPPVAARTAELLDDPGHRHRCRRRRRRSGARAPRSRRADDGSGTSVRAPLRVGPRGDRRRRRPATPPRSATARSRPPSTRTRSPTRS